jgi:hypothetical protein
MIHRTIVERGRDNMSWEDDEIKTEYMAVESRRSSSEDETVVFDLNYEPWDVAETQERCVLLRKRTGERIVVDVPSTIGRGFQADTRITGNLAISRAHARIQLTNGKLGIVDLDSLNGTKVNGKRIPPQVSVEVGMGDEICLGSEAFKIMMEG